MYSIQILLLAWLALISAQDISTEGQKPLFGQKDGRIIGGWETRIEHFPHQVSIQMGTRHICGGALLGPNIVLSAAHCFRKSQEPELYAVRAGSTQWSTGGSYVLVRRIILHEQFNQPTTMNNDIALVHLQQSLNLSATIQPIPMVASSDFVSAQAQLFVSGWGSTTVKTMDTEPRLRYTVIVQMDRLRCAQNYFLSATVTNTMFCAGSKSGLGDRDSCLGDSGGPLVTFVDGRFRLLGIVSWGLGCANAQYPGVYTNAPAYISWIIRTLKTLT